MIADTLPAVGRELQAWRYRVLPVDALSWSVALNDPNPVHFDGALVAKLGLGDRPINQGPANIAYLYNMLAACFPGRVIATLDARMVGTVKIEDTIEVSGRIVAVEAGETGHIVRCHLLLSVCPDASPAVLASADVLFEAEPVGASSCAYAGGDTREP